MTCLLYVDCVAGVAGDMLLGALFDAGADSERVQAGLGGLGVPGLALEVTRAERHGLAARRVNVVAAADDHAHRNWADVRAIIERAGLPPRARRRAQDTFRRLAIAEAGVHGTEPDAVHFHEVGAVDALADVCGVALALEDLGVDRLVCSPLPMGRGVTTSAHGRLPLPAPATVELLKHVPLYGVELDVELVTPTGAALVAACAESFGPLPAMRVEAVGYGAGSRELLFVPNVVRVLLGVPAYENSDGGSSPVVLIETNLDDLLPELVPDAVEQAVSAGALDVWTSPAQMKKGRPGVVLSALARPAEEPAVARALFASTSTLGLRVTTLRRWELDRSWEQVEVDGELVRVKVGRLDGELVNVAPEHDDCASVARGSGRTTKAVWAEAFAAAERLLVRDGAA